MELLNVISYRLSDDIKIEVSPKSEMAGFSIKGKEITLSLN